MLEQLDIGYRYYNRMRNTGDAILPYILEELTGFNPALVSYDAPHLLGCGSIFFMATSASFIWGTGILNENTHIPPINGSRVTALRGQKSRDLLVSRGFKLADIPLGDPGIFASEVLAARNFVPRRRYRAAIVPHHSSLLHPFYQDLRAHPEFAVVNVLDDTLEPLRLIAESDVVVAQSLHGLIFGESLGKPTAWISEQFNDGWQFKFADWFSTTQNPQPAPYAFNLGVEELIRRAEPRHSGIDKPALKKAIPVESVIHDLGERLDFKTCRSLQPITIAVPKIFEGRLFGNFQEVRDHARGVGAVAEYANRLFKGFAERTYICLQPDDENVDVSQRQLRKICAFLDRNLTPDVCYILPRGRVPQNSTMREIGEGIMIVDSPTLIGGCLLLRPDIGALTERSMTFAV
jgi:hypothetical protein